MKKQKKPNMFNGIVCWLCLFWICLPKGEGVGVEKNTDIQLETTWCGLRTAGSRTQNLDKFFPSINAIRTTANDLWADEFYPWICQKPPGTEYGTEPQFITSYDVNNLLPVYSAYKPDLIWTVTTSTPPKWTTAKFKDFTFETSGQTIVYHDEDLKIQIADFKAFTHSMLDRGHLFAAQFATDEAQKKATYRITNAVAQDTLFNKQQWQLAETKLKDEGMRKCKHPGVDTSVTVGTPIVITGAVTGFQMNPPFQIGKMQVPTHMWTTMLCVVDANPEPEIYHMSFIGSNFQKSNVIFYENFEHFSEDLKHITSSNDMDMDVDDGEDVVEDVGDLFRLNGFQRPKKLAKFELPSACTQPLTHTGILCTVSQPIFNDWKENIVAEQRANILIKTFIKNMEISGYELQEIMTKITSAVTGGGDRKKRDVSVSQDANSAKVSFMLLKINDTDPIRDLKLSQCTLREVESSTNNTIDKHIIDMENMKHYENKAEGDIVEIKTRALDGTETTLAKAVNKEKTIRIVLSPRTP